MPIRDSDTNLFPFKPNQPRPPGRSLPSDKVRFMCKSGGRALQRKRGDHGKGEDEVSFVRFRFPPKGVRRSRESEYQFWIGRYL